MQSVLNKSYAVNAQEGGCHLIARFPGKMGPRGSRVFSVFGRSRKLLPSGRQRSLPWRVQRCNTSYLFPARPCSQLPALPEETEAGRLPRGSDSAGVTR